MARAGAMRAKGVKLRMRTMAARRHLDLYARHTCCHAEAVQERARSHLDKVGAVHAQVLVSECMRGERERPIRRGCRVLLEQRQHV